MTVTWRRLGGPVTAANRYKSFICVGRSTPHLNTWLLGSLTNSLKVLSLNSWCDVAALSSLLRQSQSLYQLDLERTQFSRQDCHSMTQALRVNQSLTKLHFHIESVQQQGFIQMGDMIRAVRSLESVSLGCMTPRKAYTQAWKAVLQGLQDSPRLRQVAFVDDSCIPTARPLHNVLSRVPLLSRLILTQPMISTTKELATALSENRARTLVELQIHARDDSFCVYSRRILIRGLERNETLKTLHLPFGSAPWVPAEVLDLLERNLTLTEITHDSNNEAQVRRNKEQIERVRRMVARNRALACANYGTHITPSLLPFFVQATLVNKWVGPSKVFRVLHCRSGELAKQNVSPSVHGEDKTEKATRLLLRHEEEKSFKRARIA